MRDNQTKENLNPAETEKLLKDQGNEPGIIVLDVRTPGEFSSGHIAGAKNIDFNSNNFEDEIYRLDKNRVYLVYCQSGIRSSRALLMMKDKGFKSLKNLDGGLSKWVANNFPVTTE